MKKSKSCKKIKKIILIIIIIWAAVFIFTLLKPLPKGVSIQGEKRTDTELSLLYDITYEKNGKRESEQQIFNRVYKIIDDAEKFIVIDMFLFNRDYDKSVIYPEISEKLTDKLIEKKEKNRDIKIIFITDEINGMYGAYETEEIKRLRGSGVEVVITNLNKLKDSNPFYSSIWNMGIRWFGIGKNGKMTNPFSKDSPKVTLRAYLKLLNFKANHRKVIVSEKEGVVSSANPHNPSGYHSNIAFSVKGKILKDIIEGEKSIAEISGYKNFDIDINSIQNGIENKKTEVSLISEGKIGKSIDNILSSAGGGDELKIGVFYLSDRKVIKAIKRAVVNGADVKILLDYNKDAFGREKNGIPNRTAAEEIYKETDGKVKIYWYKSSGEQFHTKLLYFRKGSKVWITGGSANFTRRNLRDLNLEENLLIETEKGEEIETEVSKYFEKIFTPQYSTEYKYINEGKGKYLIYRFQEWSGIGTF